MQRRFPGAGFPIAVAYKYADDFGGYLSALLTYYAFVSLFPLLLLLTTVLGLVLSGDASLQHRVETSALRQIPIVGSQLGQPRSIGGGTPGLIIGIAGSLYGGLGVAQAAQYAMNTAWSVPRNNRPNPFKARGRSLLLLATAGLALLGTTVLSALSISNAGTLGTFVKVVLFVASILLNAIVFVFVFKVATTRQLTIREVAPGAITAAVAWQLLQTFGVTYVSHVVKNASATNSVFALVLGLLAFLYLTATAVVVCVEINVVKVDHLHPRALLTPFTDNVELTAGDERTYTGQAEAQRSKGFQNIDVSYDAEHTPERTEDDPDAPDP
ncbi:MAG: YihY/virulence factor BrkB family protein [Frankia sp.]